MGVRRRRAITAPAIPNGSRAQYAKSATWNTQLGDPRSVSNSTCWNGR